MWVIVGHNVGFDISFIEAALADGTRIEPGTYLDTLVIARAGYPDLDAHKLGDLVEFFGLEVDPKHRALADAEATAALLQGMADLGQEGKSCGGDRLQHTKAPQTSIDADLEHHQATRQAAGNGGPEAEEFHDGTDLRFGKSDIQIKGRGHGAGHGVADFIKQDKRQNPDSFRTTEIFDKRLNYGFL